MTSTRRQVFGQAAAALVVSSAAAFADDYPSRPIRLVVPYPPGSGTDIVARLLGQKLGESLGQQIVVDNRPGAGATVGVDAVAKAEPDGYTLLMADVGPLAIAPTFYPKLPYDPVRDLVPIGQVAVLPFVLAANAALPVASIADLVSLGRAKPGTLTYGSTGNGAAVHLTTELFRQRTGLDMTHVPYRGSAPALTDLVAGRISVMFVNVLSAMSFVSAGQLKALAIGTPQRVPAFPNIPTFPESGLPGFTAGVWFGLLAPTGTPAPLVQRLGAETVRALQAPDLVEKLAQQGAAIASGSSGQFGERIRTEIVTWREVIRTAGNRME